MAVLRVHTRVDPDLERGLRAFMKAEGLTRSAATRELLRQALRRPATTRERGWREGYAAAHKAFADAKHAEAKIAARAGR